METATLMATPEAAVIESTLNHAQENVQMTTESNINPVAAVNQSTLVPDTTNNVSLSQPSSTVQSIMPEVSTNVSATASDNVQPNTETATSIQQIEVASVHQVTLSSDDHDDFRKWQADKRNRHITDLCKSYGNDVGSRRNTLVLRRVDCREIAPDADVLAYLIIYAMKEILKSEGKKVQVTEAEIKAYLELDFDFVSTPTLQAITDKAKELGGTESDDQE